MAPDFRIEGPFPSRKGALALREKIIACLLAERPSVGTRLPTDAELAQQSGLSPATVRRAMRLLRRQGWVDRRVGYGTFVGPRAGLPLAPQAAASSRGRTLVRLAVTSHDVGSHQSWWFSRLVLEGIETASVEHALSIELLTCRREDLPLVRKRLEQSRPDVLACVIPIHRAAFTVGDAERMGIPCLVAGTCYPELGWPCVYGDGIEGTAMAVRHLHGLGHRRIGLIAADVPSQYVFDRRMGYVQGLGQVGIVHDENLVHWTARAATNEQQTLALHAYLQRQRPTAVITVSYTQIELIGILIRSGRLSVPRDLSVITFDQAPEPRQWLGMNPTHIAQPLKEVGAKVAEYARRIADGLDAPRDTRLPCSLILGQTTAPPA